MGGGDVPGQVQLFASAKEAAVQAAQLAMNGYWPQSIGCSLRIERRL